MLVHVQLKAYEDDAVIAGYVLCQDGKKWNKMWYQIKRDCVLYKFKAHEVREGGREGRGEGGREERRGRDKGIEGGRDLLMLYLFLHLAGHQSSQLHALAWLCYRFRPHPAYDYTQPPLWDEEPLRDLQGGRYQHL